MIQKNLVHRRGFTLLEMVLSLAIGVLLLTGLYYALDMHIAATQSGRGQVDQAQVARNVLKKLQTDIKDHIATLDPYPPVSTKASTTTATSAITGATTTGTFAFNLGVQGDQDWCAIYISKVPKSVALAQTTDPTQVNGADMVPVDSDLRRITYWLNPGDATTGGLARQEIIVATSDDASMANLPPPAVDEMTTIVAPEVVALSFEYFDGTSWQVTWDGTVPGTDGITPIGPPIAIRITMSIARTENLSKGLGDPTVRQYQHVVEIPTASRYANWPMNTLNPNATPQSSTGTTTPSSSGTTGGGG